MKTISSMQELPAGTTLVLASHSQCSACVPVKQIISDHPNAFMIDVHSDAGAELAASLHIRAVPVAFILKDRAIADVAYSSNDCVALAKRFVTANG